jgi:membrane protease YdiL (CAAX protease family)
MKQQIKRIFQTDDLYKENISTYTKVDGIIAIVYYLIFMITYFIMGRVYAEYKIYLGIICNISIVILCIIIIWLRNQKISTLGLNFRKMKQSIILGVILGILLVLTNNVLPSITSGCHLNKITQILYNAFYYFIIIAFVEEIAFRGFIQTRIYGLIKNEIIAIITVSLMFSLMHIPFQMAMAGTTILSFISSNVVWLILLFFWHIIFNFLHKKYNCLFANTIFHGFMDWGNNLFV